MLPKCVNRAAYLGARAVCRQEILDKGICEIPGFLKPSAVNRILSSAEELKRRTCGFRSFEEHNVYLEEKRDTSRVRSASFSSSKLLVNQAELTQDCPEIIELFRWDGLRFLLQEAFGLKRLFCSADPLGGVYLNFFEKGDQLGWHFDRSECLILNDCLIRLSKHFLFNIQQKTSGFVKAAMTSRALLRSNFNVLFRGDSLIMFLSPLFSCHFDHPVQGM